MISSSPTPLWIGRLLVGSDPKPDAPSSNAVDEILSQHLRHNKKGRERSRPLPSARDEGENASQACQRRRELVLVRAITTTQSGQLVPTRGIVEVLPRGFRERHCHWRCISRMKNMADQSRPSSPRGVLIFGARSVRPGGQRDSKVDLQI